MVAPGTVVRWTGAGVTECRSMGRSWTPLGSACWYPIDLLLPPTGMELERIRDGRVETTLVRVSAYPYPVEQLHVDPGKVNLATADAARAGREAARIRKLWSLETPRRFELPLGPPLEPLPTGRSFGNRRILNGEPRSPHSGVDFAAQLGEPVLAVANGTVVLAEDHFFAGNSVFVDHGDGLISMSFHLSRMDVRPGDDVRRGQVLGLVGATGRVTGPHLHFAIRWHGARVDAGLLIGPVEKVPTVE
jgi:murein DD-endopeptidase MepM/ murein hydrolase activator NlpD